jgi:hypothetical protein
MNLNLEKPKFLSDTKLIKINDDDNNDYYDSEDWDEKEVAKQNIELSVNKFFQSFNIEIGYDPLFIKNFKLDFEKSNDDIIIKKDFIFALINFEVLSDLNIPSISFNVITDNYWIREKL